MARKSSGVKDVIKSGDIIWTRNVYPKKISYHFFPISDKPIVFSSDPKIISLFKEEDKIDEPCTVDGLQQAFDDARQAFYEKLGVPAVNISTGPAEEKVSNNKGSHVSISSSSASSSNQKKASKTVKQIKSTKENGVRTSVDKTEMKPVKSKPEKKRELEKKKEIDKVKAPEENGQPETVAESMLEPSIKSDYKDGDVVVVSTELGMWPAKFVSLESNIVVCQLFPLEENAEHMQSLLELVHEFPEESINQFINTTIEENPNLANAFESVKSYLQTRAKEQKKKDRTQKKAKKQEDKVEEKKKEEVEVKSRKRQQVEEVEKDATSNKKKKSSSDNSGTTLRESPRKKKKADEPKLSKKAITFCERITSDEAQQFIKEIFSKHSNYELPENADLYFDFRNGGLLKFEEAEIVIAQILREYSLCTKLPAMQHLCKMHYISTIVFPNLCIFGLSKVYSCSLEEAKKKYEILVTAEINQLKNPQTSNGSEDGSAFDNLVNAAVRLKGVEEKKNGSIGTKSSKSNGTVNDVNSEH